MNKNYAAVDRGGEYKTLAIDPAWACLLYTSTHAYLVEHTNAPVRRDLMDEIDWNERLIGIKGTRGVGKTTFLLQYAKEKFGTDRSCLFINMNNFYFSGHSSTPVAMVGDDLWIAVKFQSNSEIAGSPRNSFRASVGLDYRR